MDRDLIALFALIAMGLDLLGACSWRTIFLAGAEVQFRTLLRAILFCFIFIGVYSIVLDWRFSLLRALGLD
jgi:hypothetical protein